MNIKHSKHQIVTSKIVRKNLSYTHQERQIWHGVFYGHILDRVKQNNVVCDNTLAVLCNVKELFLNQHFLIKKKNTVFSTGIWKEHLGTTNDPLKNTTHNK